MTNEHTTLFALGEIEETNFLTLQDVKNYFLHELDNNPFDMIEGEANAKICADAHKLCIRGINLDGEKQQLVCKELGINRVCYFNIQLIRELVKKTSDKAKLKIIEQRLKLINELPNREGYNPK